MDLISPETISWRCDGCGQQHTGLPLDYGCDEPNAYACLTAAEKGRAFLNSDFCDTNDGWFFVRGLIEIPVIGLNDCFRWGAWVSLSKPNFDYTVRHWNDPESEDRSPMFGWLNSRLPLYPDTLNLKTNVHLRAAIRPWIELESTDHPLALEQQEGITLERVQEIAMRLMHPSKI